MRRLEYSLLLLLLYDVPPVAFCLAVLLAMYHKLGFWGGGGGGGGGV